MISYYHTVEGRKPAVPALKVFLDVFVKGGLAGKHFTAYRAIVVLYRADEVSSVSFRRRGFDVEVSFVPPVRC